MLPSYLCHVLWSVVMSAVKFKAYRDTGKHPPVINVPIDKISLKFRDDIAFRIYFLMTKDYVAMGMWDNVSRGDKEQDTFKSEYVEALYKLIKQSGIRKPIYSVFSKKKDTYYTSGGSRIPCAYVAGHKTVPLYKGGNKRKIMKSYNLETKHWVGMPEDILERLRIRRAINTGLPTWEYEIPELGFRGKRKVKISWLEIRDLWYECKDGKVFLEKYMKLAEREANK